MTNQITTTNTASEIMESVVIGGDLSKLTPEQRVNYYKAVCESLGLNPLTKPFDYIVLKGRLTLYARKDATDQIREKRGVSIVKLEREKIEDIYTVTAYAVDKTKRQDSSIGAVCLTGLKGDDLANAIMKAETKAKRRVTLSICGLGMTDESEIETIPNVRVVTVNQETGEVIASAAPIVQAPITPPPDGDMPINVANAMARIGSDGKKYGDATDKQLNGKVIGITRELNKNNVPEKQDDLLAKLDDIQIIQDWRKNHVPVTA